jgi:hypothetical protein
MDVGSREAGREDEERGVVLDIYWGWEIINVGI